MKKVFVLLLAVLCLSVVNNAQQKGNMLSAGAVLAVPMGSFGDAVEMGFGATATFEMPFANQIVGYAEVGYLTWSGKLDGWSTSAIPIMAGAKYFFDKKGGFYAVGTAGFHLFTVKTEIFGMSTDVSSTEFAIGAGAGYEYLISKTMVLDVAAKFMIISDLNYLNIRAGLKFPLGK